MINFALALLALLHHISVNDRSQAFTHNKVDMANKTAVP